jgi:hypothetical protein
MCFKKFFLRKRSKVGYIQDIEKGKNLVHKIGKNNKKNKRKKVKKNLKNFEKTVDFIFSMWYYI